MPRGGARPGAGRPKGTTQAVTRKNRTIKAFDDEWEDIHFFATLRKKNPDVVIPLINQLKKTTL